MRIPFDRGKRDRTLRDRGLYFADAALVFEGTTVEVLNVRGTRGGDWLMVPKTTPVAPSASRHEDLVACDV